MKELFTAEEMPFSLIQDTEQDGARVQAQIDRKERERKANERAQIDLFEKMPKYATPDQASKLIKEAMAIGNQINT